MIALDPKDTFDYTLKDERDLPEEQRTIWHLKVLNPDDEAAIEDEAGAVAFDTGQVMSSDTPEARWKSNTSKTTIKILDLGLMGVTNLVDGKGQLVKMPPTKTIGKVRKIDRIFLQRIKLARVELANAITEYNQITDEEKQNLE